MTRKPNAAAIPITHKGTPVSIASCHASGSMSVSAMIIITADAIASQAVRRFDSRRASHAPAMVDTETSITAIHAPPPGGSPSSTGPMACVQYASGIFSGIWRGTPGVYAREEMTAREGLQARAVT